MAVLEKKAKVAALLSLTNSTGAYALGDQMASLQEISGAVDGSGDTATVSSVTLVDKDSASAAVDILFFNDEPTVASTDNVSLNISDDDMANKFLGSVRVSTTDYITTAGSSVATVKNVGLVVNSVKSATNERGTSLWAILRSAGTPTYTGTTSLSLRIGIAQD